MFLEVHRVLSEKGSSVCNSVSNHSDNNVMYTYVLSLIFYQYLCIICLSVCLSLSDIYLPTYLLMYLSSIHHLSGECLDFVPDAGV